jgi:hypothetical protein
VLALLILLVITSEDADYRLNYRTLGMVLKVWPLGPSLPKAWAVVVFREIVLRAELPTTVIAGVGESVGGSTQVTFRHLTELQL